MSINCSLQDRINNTRNSLTNKIIDDIIKGKSYIKRVNNNTIKIEHSPSSKIQNASMAYSVASSIESSFNKKYENSLYQNNNYIEIYPSNSLINTNLKNIFIKEEVQDELIKNYTYENLSSNEWILNGELYSSKEEFEKALEATDKFGILFENKQDNNSKELLKKLNNIKILLEEKETLEEVGYKIGMNEEEYISSISPEIKELLNKVKALNPSLSIILNDNTGNLFDPSNNTLYIDFGEIKALSIYSNLPLKLLLQSIVAHELSHATNAYAFQNEGLNKEFSKLYELAKKACLKSPFIDTLRNGFVLDNGLPYAFLNLQEFLSEAKHNPYFKKWLLDTFDGDKSFWQRLVDLFKKALGIEVIPYESIYNKIINIESSNDYIDTVKNTFEKSEMYLMYKEAEKLGFIPFADIDKRDKDNSSSSRYSNAIYYLELEDKFIEQFDNIKTALKKAININKEKNNKGYDELTNYGRSLLDIYKILENNKESDIIKNSLLAVIQINRELISLHDNSINEYNELATPLEKSKYLMSLNNKLNAYLPYIESLNKLFGEFIKEKNDALIELEKELSPEQFKEISNRFKNVQNILSLSSGTASAIKQFFIDKALGDLDENAVFQYLEDNSDFKAAREFVTQKEKEIEELNKKLLSTTLSTKEITNINKLIKIKKEEIANTPTSKEFFIAEITGDKKDLTQLGQLVQSSIASSSKIVQAVDIQYNKINNKLAAFSVKLLNKFQKTVIPLLKQGSKLSLKELYKNIITKEKIYYSNKKDGSFDYDERYSLMDVYTAEYIEDYQKYKKKLEYLLNKYRFEKDETLKKQYKKEHELFRKEYFEWYGKYVSSQYTDEYNKLFAIREEDLGDGISLKSWTEDIYDKIRTEEAKLKEEKNEEVKKELIDNLNLLNIELKERVSYYGKDKDSLEYKIAVQYEKYNELRNKIYKSEEEMGDNAYNYELFNLNKARMKASLDAKSYEKWLKINTNKVFTEEFEAMSNKLDDMIKEAEEEYYAIVKGDKYISDTYEKYKELSKKYRDASGIIQGEYVTEEDRIEIKRLQYLEEELKNKLKVSIGSRLTKDEKNRIFILSEKARDGLLTTEEDLEYQSLIEKNSTENFSAEELQSIEVLKQRISELIEAKADLYKRTETENYFIEKEKEVYRLAKILADDINSRENGDIIEFSGIEYEKRNGQYYNTLDNVLMAPFEKEAYLRSIVNIEQSEWYKLNHITLDKYNKDTGRYEEVTEPIYIWWERSLKDERNYKEIPSYAYRNKEVKEEFINKEYREIKPGYAYPKLVKDDKYINKDYLELQRLNNDDYKLLEKLREEYKNAQNKARENGRLGNILPSVRFTKEERLVNGVNTVLKEPSSLLKSLKEFRDTNFKQTDQDNDTEGVIRIESQNNQVVPLKFIGRITTDEQSMNVMNSILEFSMAVEEKNQLDEITPLLENLVQISNVYDKVKIVKKKSIDEEGNPIIIEEKIQTNDKSNISKALRNLIDRRSYGKTTEELLVGDVSVNKVTDKLLGAGSFSSFAFQLFAAIKNLISGKFQDAIRVNFNSKLASKMFSSKIKAAAEAATIRNSGNLIEDVSKLGDKSILGQMLDLFGGVQGSVKDHLGRKTQWSKVFLSFDIPTFMKNYTEFQIQVSNFIAFAMTERVEHENGKDSISLYDAFIKDADGNLKLKDGYILKDDQINKFTLRVRNYNLNVNGAYGADKNNAQMQVWGKLLFNMTGYLVPGIRDRYTKNGWNMSTEEYEKAFYLTGVRFIKALYNYNIHIGEYWATMTDKEKLELGSFLKETIIGLIFIILSSAAFMGLDDDDELKDVDKSRLFALSLLLGVKSELDTFHPLFGMNEIVRKGKSPFVAMKTVDQIRLALTNLIYIPKDFIFGTDDAVYKRDSFIWEKGDYKFVNNLAKLISVTPGNMFSLLFSDEAPEALYKQVKSYQ